MQRGHLMWASLPRRCVRIDSRNVSSALHPGRTTTKAAGLDHLAFVGHADDGAYEHGRVLRWMASVSLDLRSGGAGRMAAAQVRCRPRARVED